MKHLNLNLLKRLNTTNYILYFQYISSALGEFNYISEYLRITKISENFN